VLEPNVDSKLTRAGLAELALSKNSTETPVHGLAAQSHTARRLRASRRAAGPALSTVAVSRRAHAQQHNTAMPIDRRIGMSRRARHLSLFGAYHAANNVPHAPGAVATFKRYSGYRVFEPASYAQGNE
jgi:hypothetical protein